jgi:hypothetical protein
MGRRLISIISAVIFLHTHPTTAIQQLPMHPMHEQIKSSFKVVLISCLFINVVGWISPD